jgi:hypothetical protein
MRILPLPGLVLSGDQAEGQHAHVTPVPHYGHSKRPRAYNYARQDAETRRAATGTQRDPDCPVRLPGARSPTLFHPP